MKRHPRLLILKPAPRWSWFGGEELREMTSEPGIALSIWLPKMRIRDIRLGGCRT